MPSLVAYYRVSTAKQGNSGLGLEAQTTAVEAHTKATGGKILASYREIESGKHSDRPELAKALLHVDRGQEVVHFGGPGVALGQLPCDGFVQRVRV
jgi:DNA invertase Pin-like site-specific DNA recombinase